MHGNLQILPSLHNRTHSKLRHGRVGQPGTKIERCARYINLQDLFVTCMTSVYAVYKLETVQKSINRNFLAVVSLTYLLTNERGIKCCSVDMSSEQSSIMLTPLNWRTRHGAELVLPKEYWKKYRKPPKLIFEILKPLNFELIAFFSYQLHIMS